MIEEKYIKLLLERCLKIEKGKPLFISYNKVIKPFVKKVVNYANNIGITDIYLENKKYKEIQMQVSKPIFMIGFKDENKSEDIVKKHIAIEIIMNMLLM